MYQKSLQALCNRVVSLRRKQDIFYYFTIIYISTVAVCQRRELKGRLTKSNSKIQESADDDEPGSEPAIRNAGRTCALGDLCLLARGKGSDWRFETSGDDGRDGRDVDDASSQGIALSRAGVLHGAGAGFVIRHHLDLLP